MRSAADFIAAGLAAVAAGLVNALAGGGTLITFPMLTFLGLPSIEANITSTVALCPGYLGGTLAQLKDMHGQKKRLRLFLGAGIIGGVLGGVLLLHSSERLFRAMVPFLILLASGLLAAQSWIRAWLIGRVSRSAMVPRLEIVASLLVCAAAIYVGYFGAGLSVIMLAVLGLTIDDSLTRLNACKQAIAFAVNSAVAVFFIFSHRIVWPMAVVMAIGSLIGGALGGRLAGHIRSETLRWAVVSIGIIVGIAYLIR
jgi:uncharacterized membrane protein YfcA